jgi:molybdopterin-containing oxidoreductase family iron-sulfur binding subunit
MKTIPPPCPVPETGPKYWRSLDELADTPEFREWVGREFPAGASEWLDPVSRRHFVQIMSASFLLAGFGLTGCRRPEEKILPFGKQPENYIHGLPEYYATSMPTRGGAVPLLAKSSDGRPTKLEGNADHPANQFLDRSGNPRKHGGTDHFAQASILSLYDPDRAIRFSKGGNEINRQTALQALDEIPKNLGARSGEGLAFLLQRNTSPSRARLQGLIAQKFPKARWHVHEPVELNLDQQAASLAFGKSVRPVYHLDKAKVIVSLDCDFIGSEDNTTQFCRDFAAGRKLSKAADSMSRLYALEGLMTLTGANADHRLRLSTSAIASAAAALGEKVLGADGAELVAALKKAGTVDEKQARFIATCGEDLLKNKGGSLVLAGHRQPLAVHLMALAMNVALGNLGTTLTLQEAPEEKFESLADLAKSLNSGAVDTLVILGANPVYDAPVDLAWGETQRKAKNVVRLGYYEDETGAVCDYHFPAAHYLESWGDARAYDGTLVGIQPLIEPLFGGLTELEFLARIGGLEQTRDYEITRETFRGFSTGDFEESWKKFLHDGFLANTAAKDATGQFNFAAAAKAAVVSAVPAATRDQLEVVFQRDASVDDGRWNNNGWLQEMPDPITKVTWENVIQISPKTMADLGFQAQNDLSGHNEVSRVRLELGGRSIEGPVWIQPGLSDNTVVLALGYGRKSTGRIGRGSGYDAYALRSSTALYFATGGKLTPTGQTHEVSSTQSHWSMEGRSIVREANLAEFQKTPDFAKELSLEPPPEVAPLYPNPLDKAKEAARHQWGMVIDLNSCLGCSSCVIACQSENNVPIVGKQMVGKSREMHWLRIDRYFSGGVDDPQMVNQPMLCQHCEAAPCENVCPVNATSHDAEGLNVMTYNRCVGTRYCSNNCPYKVRRFNYFDYNRRPLGKLYRSPLTSINEGEWEFWRWLKNPDRGSRPDDEWELIKMVKNPDVTVRMRGVMEKCSFCLQRIEQAKIAQKVKAANTGDMANVEVPDGAVQTACQQACPAEAITFGNIKDRESRVSKLKEQERNYSVLEFLHTKPRLTYLARVRNPNPEMPDYQPRPFSAREFIEKNGKPSEHNAEGHPAAAHEGEKGGL